MSGRSHESYGQSGVTWVDRFGVWLSQRAIRRELPKGDELHILELGCGFHATQLRALEGRMKHGYGVDFQVSPKLRSLTGYTFWEGAIEAAIVKIPQSSMDVVMMISVLEHLKEPAEGLRNAFEFLRPGGVLMVNVPTWRGKFFLEFSAFRLGLSPKVEMDDHKMYYTKRDLWPLLVRAGFKPSEIELSYHKFGLNLFATARKPQNRQ